ncbi:MAG: C40 family peptidase [Burkholderiaceae bacterium]
MQSGLHSAPQGSTNPALASTALSVLGIKYRFGGEAPSTGFDCSGLVIYAAEKSLGLKLPRKSRDIAREGIAVKNHELKKGDLVFFNTRGHRFSHVGIYLGNRKFVHAPRSGSVVRIEDMDIGYWKKRYNGARRLVASTGQASQ